MLKQYANYHGYKVIGYTILDHSILHNDDYKQLCIDIQNTETSNLLIEDISKFVVMKIVR